MAEQQSPKLKTMVRFHYLLSNKFDKQKKFKKGIDKIKTVWYHIIVTKRRLRGLDLTDSHINRRPVQCMLVPYIERDLFFWSANKWNNLHTVCTPGVTPSGQNVDQGQGWPPPHNDGHSAVTLIWALQKCSCEIWDGFSGAVKRRDGFVFRTEMDKRDKAAR